MNTIEEAVRNHLSMKTNGALMITGDWGSGKTYYLKNHLLPKIDQEGQFRSLLVSVYGETEKINIAQKVAFAFANTKSKGWAEGIAGMAQKIGEIFPKTNEYINIEKLLTGNGENLLKLLPHDKLLICFDDVERMSEKLNINDFLGLVNDLVENCGAKVIIIANDKKIRKERVGKNQDTSEDKKNPIIYLEKTVEKAVHYVPDMAEVFDQIVSLYEEGNFKTFLISKKPFILNSLIVNSPESKFKNLKEELSNIRTFKFALEHFRLIFAVIDGKKKWDDQLIIKQLEDIWLFTLGVSNEFRRGDTVTYSDKKGLETLSAPLPQFDLKSFYALADIDEPDAKEETNEDANFADQFRDKYFSRLDWIYR